MEKTHWYRLEAWDGSNGKGLVSSVIEPYVKKGITVFAQGFPIIEEYEKEGVTHRSFKVKLAGAGSTFRLAGKASAEGGSAPKNDIPFDDIPI